MENFKELKAEFEMILKEATWTNPEYVESSNKGDSVDLSLMHKDLELNARLKGRHFKYLKKINFALKKMERGEYGICEDCECTISETRLKARPTAQTCIDCQEEKESFRRHATKSESLSLVG